MFSSDRQKLGGPAMWREGRWMCCLGGWVVCGRKFGESERAPNKGLTPLGLEGCCRRGGGQAGIQNSALCVERRMFGVWMNKP